ncbi:MAG: type II toxin-antitoxin system RelE/ParE family toxin [Balneolales bacterium]
MIRSFKDKTTKKVFDREHARGFPPDIHRRAKRKLNLIDAVDSLEDLKVPPGNQLEQLSGNRYGQWSIRINRQWRICFEWRNGDAYNVEIVDYHYMS